LILLISLLLWRLIELVMRTALQAGGATVPGWDNKPTARPTAYMVTWKFKGVLILCFGAQRRLAKPLTDTQLAFLQALTGTAKLLHATPARWIGSRKKLRRLCRMGAEYTLGSRFLHT
jgi:hypothetical protein